MKQTRSPREMVSRLIIPMMVLSMAIGFTSCKKDESNKPAPSVTVTPTTASNVAGAAVTASVQVDSPEGGSSLVIKVNGTANTALPDVALDGTASQTVPISFTIPANAVVGATYVIDFQAIDKKNQNSAGASFVVTVSSVPAKTVVTKSGNIVASETWTADKIYVLDGFVRVGKDEKVGSGASVPQKQVTGVTLTIEAGTVIMGKPAASGPGGTLIVQRGNKIVANGTAAKPIVFTSQKAIGLRKTGDWGGVVLCGQAANNVVGSTSTGVNGIEELEGGYGGFHGGGATPDNADNSGTLRYVRIEYAGYPINPNQEINGLTFGSVGSGTTISYVQVAYSNDDSFEWFGGTVNCDHLISYKAVDDDFDTDNGFSGTVQFGIALRDPLTADQSGSNGFECDNNAAGTSDAPLTGAKFSNMSIIGGKYLNSTAINVQFQNGAQIRRNAEQDIYNSFITGMPNGVYFDGQLPANSPVDGAGGVVSKLQAGSGKVEFKNNVIAGVDGWGGNGFGRVASADEIANVTAPTGGSYPFTPNNEYSGAGSSTVPPRGRVAFAGQGAFTSGVFAETNSSTIQLVDGVSILAWLKSKNNSILARWTDAGISNTVFDPITAAPTFTVTGLLASGADFTGLPVGTGSPSTGFVSVAYRGAFGSTDWTTAGGSWVNWNPAITDYSK